MATSWQWLVFELLLSPEWMKKTRRMLCAVLFVHTFVVNLVQVELGVLFGDSHVVHSQFGQGFARFFRLGFGQDVVVYVVQNFGFRFPGTQAFGLFQHLGGVFRFHVCVLFERVRRFDLGLALLAGGLLDGNGSFAGLGAGVLAIELSAFRGRFRNGTFFAFFKVAEVVANRNTDAFEGLFSDPGNLFQLLGRHVCQRLDGGNARGDQLLDDAFAQFGDLLDGRRRSAGKSLHLLLDFLALLFLALDVDLPAEELGGETNVLTLLADGERELGVVDDHFQLLIGKVADRNTADLGRLQGLLGEGRDLFAELNDVDLFPAQFAND